MSNIRSEGDRTLFAALERRHLNNDRERDEVDLPPSLTQGIEEIVTNPSVVAALDLRDAVHRALGPLATTEHSLDLTPCPEMVIPPLDLHSTPAPGEGSPLVDTPDVITMGDVINFEPEGGVR